MSSFTPPGGAGRPAAGAAIPASELPDIRNRLISFLRLPSPQNVVRSSYAQHAASGLQMPADPAIGDPSRQADLLISGELRRLREASLFWVSPDMTTLCQAAARTMPAFLPGPADLPARSGLMYFAAPLGDYKPWTRIILSPGGGASVILPGEPVPICAVSWGPWDARGTWPGGGTWFTFYSRADAPEIARHHDLPLADAARVLPPLMPDNELACPASEAVPIDQPLEEAVRDPDSVFSWMHLVLCAFRIMAASRTASVADQQLPRPVRRRSRSAGVTAPESPVRLVDIRARGSHRHAGAGTAHHAGPQVRFPVRGHWRNQYFARSGQHRPTWIDEYVKGPADAPFRVPKTVYVLRQPGEPASRQPPDGGQELEP